MGSTVWKYTVKSIEHYILNEYGNYNMSLLVPEQTDLSDNTTRRDLYVLALLRFKTAYVLFPSFWFYKRSIHLALIQDSLEQGHA